MTCSNCHQAFTVTTADKAFYQIMEVPEPTQCPACRHQLRCAYRNEATLYNRTCSLCKKPMISMYSEDKPFPVYCLDCFYSDKWDARDYGIEFDFSKPFFDQFAELRKRVPRIALLNDTSSVNSDYTNHVYNMKDCYLVSDAIGDERLLYCNGMNDVQDCVDCSYMSEHTQLCYESMFIENGYNLKYCSDCVGCRDSAFLKDCSGVSNSFMCVGLHNVEYHFKNRAYSEAEYKEILKRYTLTTRAGVAEAEAEFETFALTVPHKFYHGQSNEDSSGDYLRNDKLVRHSFDVRRVENGAYLFGVFDAKDVADMMVFGAGAERVYMGQAVGGGVYNVIAGNVVWKTCKNVFYCDNLLMESQDCFGGISLKKNQYCILNKQYSKEEYEVLLPKVIAHMRATKEWGEYFPQRFSLFSYNESDSMEFFPLSREAALAQGWTWQEHLPGTFGKETLAATPEDITTVTASITKEVLKCSNCARNYRITPQELVFNQQQAIPLPATCPMCRRRKRLMQRPPFKLWTRSCMCQATNHAHSGNCGTNFETAYAPERKELVYCETCYQKEIL